VSSYIQILATPLIKVRYTESNHTQLALALVRDADLPPKLFSQLSAAVVRREAKNGVVCAI